MCEQVSGAIFQAFRRRNPKRCLSDGYGSSRASNVSCGYGASRIQPNQGGADFRHKQKHFAQKVKSLRQRRLSAIGFKNLLALYFAYLVEIRN